MPILRNFAWLALLAPSLSLAASRVVAVSISGVIQPITVEVVSNAIAQAEAEHASLLLLRLNTPGGLLDSTRLIIQKLDSSPIPVAAYVTPSGGRAASAGFFLLEAADIAALAPGTNTGASSPVLLTGRMDPILRSKIENDSAALLRTLTSSRHRNMELAEKTIREARAFTDQEALDNHLIEKIAPNETALLDWIGTRDVIRCDGRVQHVALDHPQIIESIETTRERFISVIGDPNIGFLLLVLGALGIYLEFSHPGLIFPGVAGAVLLLLGLSSLSVFPINWIGIALLILALVLFALEAKFTSHGVLGAGGVASMIFGALLLINGPPELRIHLFTAVAVTLPFALITVLLVSLVVRARAAKVITGPEGMLNQTGVAQTSLEPSGTVLVHGELWNAVSSPAAPAGASVRVVAVDGLTLRVEPVSSSSSKT
ncbi:MAG TPA: NfeD family protein [Bryobacteraceae bacterium]|nr:NfeD family protein [Bryobacteraceae bacterium]